MAENIFSKISTLINRVVDIITQGNLERIRILGQFNTVFENAYFSGEFNRLCSVTTSKGDPRNRHELSAFYLRSGFKITIKNDDLLKKTDYSNIAGFVVSNKPFIRQLMALGYDTLIIKGKSSNTGLLIPLKDIIDLREYMIR